MAGRILVVDDVAANRIILKAKLAMACYDVDQAGDGDAALHRIAAHRPDLILLDLAMPGRDGIEVLTELKSRPDTAGIPVIIVTSSTDRRARIAALRAGAEDVMAKPVDDLVLLARVRSVLRTKLLSDELDLRDDTRRALGFSEPDSSFGAAPAIPAGAAAGRIALVAPDRATADKWRAGLAGQHRGDIVERSRDQVLQQARLAAAEPEMPRTLPELYVISADLTTRGDGLMLLSELRATPSTANAAILIALPPASAALAPMALDLGASDLLAPTSDAEELALRVGTQMHRSRAADAKRRRLQDGLRLAVTDPLTGLANRRYALSHLERAIGRAREKTAPFAVLLLDLDRFKDVNDVHGHLAGDAVLREVAARMERCARSTDLVARIGGEEFLVVLPETNLNVARIEAERLRTCIQDKPIALPPLPGATSGDTAGAQAARGPIYQTVSIGMAGIDPDPDGGPGGQDPDSADDVAESVSALLQRADAALYEAKAGGRNRISEAPQARAGSAAA